MTCEESNDTVSAVVRKGKCRIPAQNDRELSQNLGHTPVSSSLEPLNLRPSPFQPIESE